MDDAATDDGYHWMVSTNITIACCLISYRIIIIVTVSRCHHPSIIIICLIIMATWCDDAISIISSQYSGHSTERRCDSECEIGQEEMHHPIKTEYPHQPSALNRFLFAWLKILAMFTTVVLGTFARGSFATTKKGWTLILQVFVEIKRASMYG